MPVGLIGTKVGMTQVYDDNGIVSPVTVLKLGPCPVLQIKGTDKQPNQRKADKYHALQLGFEEKVRDKATKPERGHVSGSMASKRRTAGGDPLRPKADVEPPRVIREFRLAEASTHSVGTVLTVDGVFKEIKAVDVIAKRKGRGFAGVIKRHNFGGMPAAHGAKKVHRQAGGTGSLASNRGSGRMKKGKKMAGHMGAVRCTTQNLQVIKTDSDRGLIMIKGAVPGSAGGWVTIKDAVKKPVPDTVIRPAALKSDKVAAHRAAEAAAEAAAAAEAEHEAAMVADRVAAEEASTLAGDAPQPKGE